MRFRKAYIEITNTCDLSCGFCPGTSRTGMFMDRALFTCALTQLRGMTTLLHFHVMGEPLLHPDLGQYLDLCAEYNLRVNLVTNGRSLARRAPELLGKPSLKQISVSLQSLEQPVTEDYFTGIEAFISKARELPGLAISLRLWTFDHIASHPHQRALLQRLETAHGVKEPLDQKLHTAGFATLTPNIHINCAPQFEWPDLDKMDHGPRGTCLGLREQVAILADGTVVPCCLDRNGYMSLGSIRTTSLAGILAGDRAVRIRNGFCRGELTEELCRKCTYRRRFDHAE